MSMTKPLGIGLATAVLFLSSVGFASGAASDDDIATLKRAARASARIASEAKPAVVFIKAEKTVRVPEMGAPFEFNDPFGEFGEDFFERFFRRRFPEQSPREHRQMGQGSGFIYSKEGYILTNHHVVGDADKITVTLPDGREFQARLVGSDPSSDVAVIRIEGEDLPVLPLGDSDELLVGEWVMAIGNPFGLSHTITVGIVSAKGRNAVGITDYEDYIQTDAAINPGNSGGPLINLEGKAIGINTAIFSRSGGYMGIGFAIPINMAKAISRQLTEKGKVVRGHLGVVVQDLTATLAESFGLKNTDGVLVAEVASGSPAEKAGLMQGDIILEIDGDRITSAGQLRNRVALMSPGTSVSLGLLRDKRERNVEVEIGQSPEPETAGLTKNELTAKLGFTVKALTPQLAQRFGYEPGSGVIISEVRPSSPAALAGLRPGALIKEVNRHKVADTEEFVAALSRTQSSSVLLLVQEGRFSRFVVLSLRG